MLKKIFILFFIYSSSIYSNETKELQIANEVLRVVESINKCDNIVLVAIPLIELSRKIVDPSYKIQHAITIYTLKYYGLLNEENNLNAEITSTYITLKKMDPENLYPVLLFRQYIRLYQQYLLETS